MSWFQFQPAIFFVHCSTILISTYVHPTRYLELRTHKALVGRRSCFQARPCDQCDRCAFFAGLCQTFVEPLEFITVSAWYGLHIAASRLSSHRLIPADRSRGFSGDPVCHASPNSRNALLMEMTGSTAREESLSRREVTGYTMECSCTRVWLSVTRWSRSRPFQSAVDFGSNSTATIDLYCGIIRCMRKCLVNFNSHVDVH